MNLCRRLSNAVWDLRQEVLWDALHAHNGFIDLGLDLGLVGLCVFLVSIGRNLLRSIALARRVPRVETLWCYGYFAFIFLYNLTESSVLTRNSLFWILYVSASVTLANVAVRLHNGAGIGKKTIRA